MALSMGKPAAHRPIRAKQPAQPAASQKPPQKLLSVPFDALVQDIPTVDEVKVQAAAATNHTISRDQDGVYRAECLVCRDRGRLLALGSCQDRICVPCCLRLRVLQKKRDCQFCTTPHPRVAITAQLHLTSINDIQDLGSYVPLANDATVLCESLELRNICNALLDSSVCWYGQCQGKLKSLDSYQRLKDHLRGEHGLIVCDICATQASTHMLMSDQLVLEKDRLNEHNRLGEPLARPPVERHPRCFWCGMNFFGLEEILAHHRSEHFECTICSAKNGRSDNPKNVLGDFFKDVHGLVAHQHREHYPCPFTDECLLVCFSTKMDLHMHVRSRHDEGAKPRGGKGLKITIQELAGLQEEYDEETVAVGSSAAPVPSRDRRNGQERQRGDFRANRSHVSVSRRQQEVLKPAVRGNIARHVLHCLADMQPDEARDRLMVSALNKAVDAVLTDEEKERLQKLAKRLLSDHPKPSDILRVVELVVQIGERVENERAPINMGWRRMLNMPFEMELLFLITATNPTGPQPIYEELQRLVLDLDAIDDVETDEQLGNATLVAPRTITVSASEHSFGEMWEEENDDMEPLPSDMLFDLGETFPEAILEVTTVLLVRLGGGQPMTKDRIPEQVLDKIRHLSSDQRKTLGHLVSAICPPFTQAESDIVLALNADWHRVKAAEKVQDVRPQWTLKAWRLLSPLSCNHWLFLQQYMETLLCSWVQDASPEELQPAGQLGDKEDYPDLEEQETKQSPIGASGARSRGQTKRVVGSYASWASGMSYGRSRKMADREEFPDLPASEFAAEVSQLPTDYAGRRPLQKGLRPDTRITAPIGRQSPSPLGTTVPRHIESGSRGPVWNQTSSPGAKQLSPPVKALPPPGDIVDNMAEENFPLLGPADGPPITAGPRLNVASVKWNRVKSSPKKKKPVTAAAVQPTSMQNRNLQVQEERFPILGEPEVHSSHPQSRESAQSPPIATASSYASSGGAAQGALSFNPNIRVKTTTKGWSHKKNNVHSVVGHAQSEGHSLAANELEEAFPCLESVPEAKAATSVEVRRRCRVCNFLSRPNATSCQRCRTFFK